MSRLLNQSMMIATWVTTSLLGSRLVFAQSTVLSQTPQAHLLAIAIQESNAAGVSSQAQTASPLQAANSNGPRLTLADAEKLAIEHNPNISIARLLALAQAQVTREVRTNYLMRPAI